MDIKQFLKPDKRKIVIFVVITILFLTLYYLTEKLNKEACYSHEVIGGAVFIGGLCDFRLLPLLIIFNPIIGFTHYVNGAIIPKPEIGQNLTNLIGLSLFNAILTLPYYYIISCLIVWLYDKFRKKKEDYAHLKDVPMIMGQLEKWGKKKKK